MADLVAFLNAVFGVVLLFGLLLMACLLPFAFAYVGKLIRRLVLLAILWLVVPTFFCVLAHEFLGLFWTANTVAVGLVGALLSALAYFVYRMRHRTEKKPADLHRIERQPLMPEHLLSSAAVKRQRTKEGQE